LQTPVQVLTHRFNLNRLIDTEGIPCGGIDQTRHLNEAENLIFSSIPIA
jgi:hypothetical protein